MASCFCCTAGKPCQCTASCTMIVGIDHGCTDSMTVNLTALRRIGREAGVVFIIDNRDHRPTETDFGRSVREFRADLERSPSLPDLKLARDRRAGSVRVPVVPRLRWTGNPRIAGLDIRRMMPRQQRL